MSANNLSERISQSSSIKDQWSAPFVEDTVHSFLSEKKNELVKNEIEAPNEERKQERNG